MKTLREMHKKSKNNRKKIERFDLNKNLSAQNVFEMEGIFQR